MRKIIIALFCILNFTVYSQDLLNSRQTSFYTYIYKITNKEAKQIYKNSIWEVDSSFFHTMVATFPTDTMFNLDLPPGHYLKAYAEKNQLKFDITTIQDFDIRVLNNNSDLCIQVYDSIGNVVTDAKVKIKNRNIPFDKNTKLYRLKKSNKKGLIEVSYNNQIVFYNLDRQLNNPGVKRVKIKILYRTPVKYIWLPVNFVIRVPIDGVKSLIRGYPTNTTYRIKQFFINSFEKIACIFDDYYCNDDNRDEYKGYLVFNKPKYLPGDTVKFKAFIVNKKGTPFTKELDVFMSKGWSKKTKFTTLKPYNDGAYSYEFYLHDSLNLDLDQLYRINLEHDYKVIISGNFRYEDYELTKSDLKIRTESISHFKNKSFKLFVKGTDENNMNLLDATIEVIVTNQQVNKFFSPNVFIPDTLWTLKTELKPTNETEITIPDSVFPTVNLEYLISVSLKTSDNEILTQKKSIAYYYELNDVNFKLKDDSIQFSYEYNDRNLPLKAILSGIDKLGNIITTEKITLPYTEKLNPYYSHYKVQTDSITKSIYFDAKSPQIQCLSQRTKDSLYIVVENTQKIPFNYFIYRLNSEVERGFCKSSLKYKKAINTNKNYYISLQYLWGGEVVEENYEIPYRDKELNIKVSQPKVIYPGQKSNISIEVKDDGGNPVPGVDLTAFALTKKFKYSLPQIDYLGQIRKKREIINTFHINEFEHQTIGKKLDYQQWKILAELDSIEYFKFIYPENDIYTYSYPAEENITQFAPFVVQKGVMQAIGIIYIDHRPVYFGWSTNQQPYSFKISPGYHNIELRTYDKSIRIDSLYFPKNKKTIFSLNDNLVKKDIRIKKMPNELDYYEKNNLYKYIFPYRFTFGEKYAFVKQGGNIYLLNTKQGWQYTNYGSRYNNYYRTEFTGPVFDDYVDFKLIDGFNTHFKHEPFFEYDFEPGLLKMRSIDKDIYFPKLLPDQALQSLNDEVLTEKRINALWKVYTENKRYSTARYAVPFKTETGNSTLQLDLETEKNEKLHPLNILIVQPKKPEFVRVYPGNSTKFYDLDKGIYNIIVFYTGSKYNLIDSVQIKSNGYHYLKIEEPELFKKDTFSITVNKLIEDNIFNPNNNNYKQKSELNEIKYNYHKRYAFTGPGHVVSGYIISTDDELPVPGVSVVVKGNETIGTTSDINGYYSITIPGPLNTLVYSFVGLRIKEIAVNNQNIIDVELEAEVLAMEEVVVTAFGYKTKSSLTAASVQATIASSFALHGKVAGVVVSGTDQNIQIRGASSINANSEPLYVINGVPYIGGETIDISTDSIESIETVKDASMTAIYGARAANGVVIITTKDKSFNTKLTKNITGAVIDPEFMEIASQASSIRANFSDYAYWQPGLTTDKNGQAFFDVIFPDDVTNWSTYVLAMNGKRQSGQTQGEVKSFKPLMAQLALPRFLVEGDSTYAIGKTLNYTLDSTKLKTNFELNDSIVFSKDQVCVNSIIDSLPITSFNVDTLKAKYYLEKTDGYVDGELREIPVFKKGLEEIKGDFYILDRDTTINLQFQDSLGTVTLYARLDELDIIDVELQRLKRYMYLCNEQLASKLKAYLAEETINNFKNRKNKHTRDIKKIIKKLEKNQNSDGSWGWWGESTTSVWISTHVIEALLKAIQHGYPVTLNKQKITDYSISVLESDKPAYNKISLLYQLKLLGADIDYKRYIDNLDKDTLLTELNQFKLLELKQLCHENYDIKKILDKKQETLFGNIYFKSSNNPFSVYENDVQLSIIAYNVIKRDSAYSGQYLSKIRNYFFEKRKKANWGNTYETSQIIETILPDLLSDKNTSDNQKIIITGTVNKTINKFPYSITLAANDKIRIQKTGRYPIYLTTYQKYWNPQPKSRKNDFEISTRFENNRDILKAGTPEKLIVAIHVKKDAEYIMIEVPIPAGCSYNSKGSWFRNEVHREYFKNQVSIFCENLNKGNYQFEIDLLPRYSGIYTLNPAKVELMYFPTFNANNELKKVNIK